MVLYVFREGVLRRISSFEKEKVWPAVSGPWGNGPAPGGLWLVAPPIAIAVSSRNKPFTDKMGFAWFARITPRFNIERSGFGIHPDGGVPGTKGCIGITLEDTRPVYDQLLFDRCDSSAEPVYLLVD